MNEELPFRVYGIRFLNADLQKEQDDRVLAKDLRVGPSGVLEFTRIWPDSDTENKGMYHGEFLAEEIDREDFEEWQREAEEHKRLHHDDEGED